MIADGRVGSVARDAVRAGATAIVPAVQESSEIARKRLLRVLFFLGSAEGSLWRYAPLASELVARGHEVRLVFDKPPRASHLSLIERSARASDRLRHDVGSRRAEHDGWRVVSWLVRSLADLARYSHPRYRRAPTLRRRMTKKVLDRLQRTGEIEPVGRRLAMRLAKRLVSTTDARLSDRVIATARMLEDAIPTSRRMDRYVNGVAPDVVLVTPMIRSAEQVEVLKTARRLRIPAAICVRSWDNLTNKGLLKLVPQRVFVWNEIQRREAIELHGMPADRVVATGSQMFDEWFERRPSRTREEFLRHVGLDPSRPFFLYLCSSPFITNYSDDEVRLVERWVAALRSSDDERLRSAGVLVRPHPNEDMVHHWSRGELSRFGNVAVYPPAGARPVTEEARADFFDSMAHSEAVVGINTTAMIEAAIAGKSVLTILAPELAQESTLHFHYLLEENGGFLHVAASLDEHLAQLQRVLDGDASDEEQRRRFVQSFVRPAGLDRPATPVLADAVEELAALPVEERLSALRFLIRPVLSVEAALCALTVSLAPASRRWRRLRKIVRAKVRNRGISLARSGG